MGLDWTAGILGAVGGGAAKYTEQKKAQREWNMEQTAKQAEMERQLHIEQVTGDRMQQRNQENLEFADDLAIKNAPKKALATAQGEAGATLDPTVTKARGVLSNEAVSQAEQISDVQTENQLKVAREQNELAWNNIQKEARLKLNQGKLERSQVRDEMNAAIDAMDATPEQKQKYKTEATLASFGITLPKAKSLTAEDYTRAFKEASAHVTAQVQDNDQAAMILQEKFKMRPGKDFGPESAMSVLTDLTAASILKTGRPKEVTPESVTGAMNALAPSKRRVAMEKLSKEDPTMYNAIVGDVRYNKKTKQPGALGGNTDPTVEINRKNDEDYRAGDFFSNIASQIGGIFKSKAEAKGWQVK